MGMQYLIVFPKRIGYEGEIRTSDLSLSLGSLDAIDVIREIALMEIMKDIYFFISVIQPRI